MPGHDGNTKVFECEVCGKKLKSKSNYTNHRKMHSRKEHNAPPKAVSENRSISEQKRVYLCNICGHNCGSSSNLGVHLRRHNGQSVCECTVCGKGFPRRSDMVMHMRKHTGEKPFTCPTCTRGFSRLDKLRIHIRTHTGEKPYKCPCGRAYAQSGGLQRGLNIIPESYGTVEGVPSAGLHLNADSLVDIMFPGSWNSCMSTPHFQHHERSADGGYEGSSSYGVWDASGRTAVIAMSPSDDSFLTCGLRLPLALVRPSASSGSTTSPGEPEDGGSLLTEPAV
uniref:C2H2-type domain-containing protein n=1 Tax=Anopheles epiroticus TaxID=199890 RepID=A0A182P9P4_9DIPT